MLQGGVPDANETTDYTDATDVRLGSAQFTRRVRAVRVLISAASPLQRMRSNGQAFKQCFNHEYTRMASPPLNRPLSCSVRFPQRSESKNSAEDSGVYSATMATRATG